MSMQQHFIIFYSPGTFVFEETTLPFPIAWPSGCAITKAITMSRTITERYDATPFGFRFTTRARTTKELDSHIIKTSPMYYLKGCIQTRAQVEARNDPKEEILRSNMRGNNIARVVYTFTPWRSVNALKDTDVVLEEIAMQL